MPLPFQRHAAQDCGTLDGTGTRPGPGAQVNYPGPEIPAAARAGLAKASKTLADYPAAAPASALLALGQAAHHQQPIYEGRVASQRARPAIATHGMTAVVLGRRRRSECVPL